MKKYNLRSRTAQHSDLDSQKQKKIKVGEKKTDSKDVTNTTDVVHIESDTDTEDHRQENEVGTSSAIDAWLEHPVSEFYNFEKDRRLDCFMQGQIWAIYDEYGMPRKYVQIDEVSAGSKSISVTCLKPKGFAQPSKEENAKETWWFRLVCGTFIPYSKGLSTSRYAFSHIIHNQPGRLESKLVSDIYPIKGQVWALYKDIDGKFSPKVQEYQLVEILTDCQKDNGTKVVQLVKSDGRFKSLFQRLVKNGADVYFHIGKTQLDKFSHQVPCFRIEATDNSLLDGYLELDPSALPCKLDDFESADETKLDIDDKLLYLNFLDYKSLLMKYRSEENTVWAMYDDRDGLPRTYVVTANFLGREVARWLEPCPSTEDEKKWYRAGLPIACGNFRLNKTTEGRHHANFSHPVDYEWDQSSERFSIYPRKGEVWGIYKNWEALWNLYPSRSREHLQFEYDFVEILEDFTRYNCITAVNLVRMHGFKCLFKRQRNNNGEEIPFIASANEVYRFSHRILEYKINENSSIKLTSLMLDPFLLFHYGEQISTHLESSGEVDPESEDDFCNKFKPGEIWALHNDLYQKPCSYAVISKIFPDELKMEVMMLMPHPVHEEEMEWVDKNLPLACGTFSADRRAVMKEMSGFSHLVSDADSEKQMSFYKIFPQKGEVWAIYEDWDNVKELSNLDEAINFQMVEILSCCDEESGVIVASLIRVDGSETAFQRQSHEGFDLVKGYSRKELLRFSHRALAAEVVGVGKESIPRGLQKV